MNPRKPLKPGDLLIDIRVNGRLIGKMDPNELVGIFARTDEYQLIEGLRYHCVRYEAYDRRRYLSRRKLVHLEPPRVDRKRAFRISPNGVVLLGWPVMETGQAINLSIRLDGMAVVVE